MKGRFALHAVLAVALLAGRAQASDHADPISLKRLEAGITGLFAFPDDDRLIVILTVRRELTETPPYSLAPFTYAVHMDLHSKIGFDDAEDLARYGGTIIDSEGISSDVSIEFKLDSNAGIAELSVVGLPETHGMSTFAGARDDPFIFPKFFGTNVIAMVMSIPLAAFPDGQQDWLIWATSHQGTTQIDHVGRSLRTMLPRFDLLNTLPPSQHVATLKERHEDPDLAADIKRTRIMPLFALRPYDFVPDVMIFTHRMPAGFPNGRRLNDDVAAMTCAQGDCLLWELSFADSSQWPRQTTNDKPFLDQMPFLASPWPTATPGPQAILTNRSKLTIAAVVVAIMALFLLPWVLYVRCRRRGA